MVLAKFLLLTQILPELSLEHHIVRLVYVCVWLCHKHFATIILTHIYLVWIAYVEWGCPDLSPEVCEDKKYNHKSDIWALGCVLYELTTLHHAFDGNNLPALILKIIRGVYPPVDARYSSDLADLISSLLRENPDARPEISDILELPFLTSYIATHRARVAQYVRQPCWLRPL